MPATRQKRVQKQRAAPTPDGRAQTPPGRARDLQGCRTCGEMARLPAGSSAACSTRPDNLERCPRVQTASVPRAVRSDEYPILRGRPGHEVESMVEFDHIRACNQVASAK